MELATTIGITISEFWDITPYELSVAVKGFGRRKEIEAEEYKIKYQQIDELFISNAWLTAKLVWAKDLPELKTLLQPEIEHKEMTPEEMLNVAKALNKQFGGEIVYVAEE